MNRTGFLLTLAMIFLLFSCHTENETGEVVVKDSYPSIFPDYVDVTLPPNIAPIHFRILDEGSRFGVSIKGADGTILIRKARKGVVKIPPASWRKMLESNRGRTLTIEISGQEKGSSIRFKPFHWEVSNDEIDANLAYRLINVGYILWEKMGLYQRNLESFREAAIMVNRNTDGNCMNCHSFCRGNPERMMFHMRAKNAGTLILTEDSIFKINTKTPYTMSAAVYPSWHPEGKHIAFSLDIVNQWFHGIEHRNEVYDKASDLVVYSLETNTMTTHPAVASYCRETLPCWSADGKSLYYCRTGPMSDSIHWLDVQYDLMKIDYDVATGVWGSPETVLTAEQAGGSITFPKVSPDGRFLIFTRGSHGYFTIYNPSSDLWILDLKTGEYDSYPYNSDDVDSYHSWSQNSRWVVFSSKRSDGLCTRPYFFHIDEKGQTTKPFVLPQKDPDFYRRFKNNYNVPELFTSAVKTNRMNLLMKAKGEAQDVGFDPKVDVNALSGATRIEPSLLH
ncbi:MAG TPA: hypothetical protein PLK12_08395 [Prolixibacteraceae bacterium]|nr:hypothetical protein [Prolixibacteraceae bacterium]